MPEIQEGPNDPAYQTYLRQLRQQQLAQQQQQQAQALLQQQQAQALAQEEEAQGEVRPTTTTTTETITGTTPAITQASLGSLPSIQSKLDKIEGQWGTEQTYEITRPDPIPLGDPKLEALNKQNQAQNQSYDMRYEGFMAVSGAGGLVDDPVISRRGDPGFNDAFLVTPATQKILESGQTWGQAIKDSGSDSVIFQHGGSFMDVSGAGGLVDPVFNPNVGQVKQSDIALGGSQILAGAVGSVESMWSPTVPSIWGMASLDADTRAQTTKFMQDNPGYLVGNIGGEVIQAIVSGEILKGALGLGHEAGAIKVQKFQEIPTFTTRTMEGKGSIKGTTRILEEIQGGKIEKVGKPQWTTEILEGSDVKLIRGDKTKGLLTETWEPGRYTRVDVFDEGLGSNKITRTVRAIEETIDPQGMKFKSFNQEIKTSAQEKYFKPWKDGQTWKATIKEDVASGRAFKPTADSLRDPTWIFKDSGAKAITEQMSRGMSEGQIKAWTGIAGKSGLEMMGPGFMAGTLKGLAVGQSRAGATLSDLRNIPDLEQGGKNAPKIPDSIFRIPIEPGHKFRPPIPKIDIPTKPGTITPVDPGLDIPEIVKEIPITDFGGGVRTIPIPKPLTDLDVIPTHTAPDLITRQITSQDYYRAGRIKDFKMPKIQQMKGYGMGRAFKYEERKNPFSLWLMPKAWRKGVDL